MFNKNMTRREIATIIINQSYGRPYIWGGDNPLEGFDCSGFVLEIFNSCGFGFRDMTAAGLHEFFRKKKPIILVPSERVQFGDLLFFKNKKNNKIVHVAFALNRDVMVEAGGGDSRVRTSEQAMKRAAYVRIRRKRDDVFEALGTSVFFK